MKATTIQSKETQNVLMYFINDIRVSQYKYNDEVNRHLNNKVGCYNVSTVDETKSGNFRHTTYYSI